MAHRFFLPQRPKIRRFRKVSGRSGLKNCQKAVPLHGPADGGVRPSVYSASSLIGPPRLGVDHCQPKDPR